MSLFLYHRDPAIPINGAILKLYKVVCQDRTKMQSLGYHSRNGVKPSNSEELVTYDKSCTYCATESSVTWSQVSRAFDRQCFALSAVWNI